MLLRPLVLADSAAQEVERRLDHAERVAQLVAHRADELAEGREALLARLLGEQVFAVRVQHDGQLEVEDLAERRSGAVQLIGAIEVVLVDQVIHRLPHHVHGAEHVVLRQRDAHVKPADARAQLEVRLVPRAAEELVHPRLQRDLEVTDDRLATDQRLARALVLEDALVEHL